MQDTIVSIQHLSHRYGTDWAIKDINLTINKTGVLGLLGSNGAGKSTIMNILCGSLKQTEGSVLINNIDLARHPERAKQQIGFLPQTAPLHLDLTVEEYLRFCAAIRDVPDAKIGDAVTEAAKRCGVDHFRKRLIKNLSGGYRQRVGIAQAIIHKPLLVVLDEPTNGLDPNQIVEVRSLIKDIASERTVIFSSHILSEVQLLCTDIFMIEAGKIVFANTMDAFDNYVEPHSIIVKLKNPPAIEIIEKIPGVEKVTMLTREQMRIFFDRRPGFSQQLIEFGVYNNWQTIEATLEKSSLDEVFAQLSQKN